MGKMAVKVRAGAMRNAKPNKKSHGCEICSQRFSAAKEAAVHMAENHLEDLRIGLQKTSISSKSIVVAKKKVGGGGRVEVWDANTTYGNGVGYSKGIISVGTKGALLKAVGGNFEGRKRLSCDGGESDDEVTFNYIEERAVGKEALREMNEDTDEEDAGTIDENSIERSLEGGADENISGTAETRKENLWQKLVAGRKPNCILPECFNCEEVLESKVYMCQVGHKFCKTCLRRKKVESVDLTLTCSAHCGMDIIGRDRGMEAYLQKLMV